jgi:hypothetical protein
MIRMPRPACRFLALVPALLAEDCVSAATTVIPNPAIHHSVAANLVPQADTERASFYDIPNLAFVNEATLLTLDGQNVCFAVTLRVEGQQPQLAALTGWRVYLRGDPDIEIMQPVFGPPTAPSVHTFQGSIPHQEYMGSLANCGRWGCSSSPRYMTVRQPANIPVITESGSVCFAHGGSVNAGTRQITLHLDAHGDMTRRLAFRWQFAE